MKKVVSISLGSSKRNHAVEMEINGCNCHIERIGTDGDMKRMVALIKEMDGKVDAFGLGGIDIYIQAGTRRYTLRDAKKIAGVAKETPLVDGSGLKNTLERKVIKYLQSETDLLHGSPLVLIMSGTDRYGMAEALHNAGCRLMIGDLVFAIGLPIVMHSLKTLNRVARLLAPLAAQLPFSMLYPTGEKQVENKPKAEHLFRKADIIAGDFHFIYRYMPPDMKGKIVITNTTTADDVQALRERGIKTLVTTTPELNGRTFGTNVMEALLVALSGKKRELKDAEYEELLIKANIEPRIMHFQ